MRRALILAALALAAAGCSSSSSSSAPHASASPAVTSMSGTETFGDTLTGEAAMANTPVYHLTFRGPVNATATWSPPGGNKVHQVTTFHTTAGNLVVSATVPQSNAPPKYIGAPCRYSFFATHVTYVIDGAQSTGKWAGAAGHGRAVVSVTAELPKLSNGKCNLSQNAKPLSVKSVFAASGPVTIRT